MNRYRIQLLFFEKFDTPPFPAADRVFMPKFNVTLAFGSFFVTRRGPTERKFLIPETRPVAWKIENTMKKHELVERNPFVRRVTPIGFQSHITVVTRFGSRGARE
jgi:hypothetical protein